GANETTGHISVILRFRFPTGIVRSLLGGGEPESDKVIDPALFFCIDPLVGIEGAVRPVPHWHCACDFRRQVVGAERGDRAQARVPRNQPRPAFLNSARQRRHETKAGYNHSAHRGGVRPKHQAACVLSMYFTASPTVTMDSAASSGISMPNSSSNAMTSSTVSSESAPRSSIKDAVSLTLSASTFRCSSTIFFTRSAVSLIGF